MTLTVTDLFCGAGGSSLGAEQVPGVQLAMAANHWAKAIEVHQNGFPHARHDCADLSAVDFRRYPPTDILLASPECTNHSASKGVSRKKQDANLFDIEDPSAVRSRATMWDVHRYIEAHRPAAVVVENVVDARSWIYWPSWWQAFTDAHYTARVLSINSMHAGPVPQSRDRIYVVAVRDGLKVDLDLQPRAWCPKCGKPVDARQSFKRLDRQWGRYRQQYVYRCGDCTTIVEPPAMAAAEAIDWQLPSTRIGDRKKPLAPATLRRIRIGLERYGIAVVVPQHSGSQARYDANRVRPVDEPCFTQQASNSMGIASVVAAAGQTWERPGSSYARAWPIDGPLPVQQATIQHGVAFIDTQRRYHYARPVTEPNTTMVAGSVTHALVCPPLIDTERSNTVPRSVADPLSCVTAWTNHHSLITPPAVMVQPAHGDDDSCRVRGVDQPWPTQTASDDRQVLVQVGAYYHKGYTPRNQKVDGGMTHPVTDPLGTVTASDHHALLVPYYRTGVATPVHQPSGTITTRDRQALLEIAVDLDDCLFRMFEPHEVGAAMAFPATYLVEGTKKDVVRLYGNAVTPPPMAWIVARIAQALAA